MLQAIQDVCDPFLDPPKPPRRPCSLPGSLWLMVPAAGEPPGKPVAET